MLSKTFHYSLCFKVQHISVPQKQWNTLEQRVTLSWSSWWESIKVEIRKELCCAPNALCTVTNPACHATSSISFFCHLQVILAQGISPADSTSMEHALVLIWGSHVRDRTFNTEVLKEHLKEKKKKTFKTEHFWRSTCFHAISILIWTNKIH